MAKSNLFVVTFNNKLLKRYTVILCDDPMMRRENLFCELQVIRQPTIDKHNYKLIYFYVKSISLKDFGNEKGNWTAKEN